MGLRSFPGSAIEVDALASKMGSIPGKFVEYKEQNGFVIAFFGLAPTGCNETAVMGVGSYRGRKAPLRDTFAATHTGPPLQPWRHSTSASLPASESGYVYRTTGSDRDECRPPHCRIRCKPENSGASRTGRPHEGSSP